MCFRGKSAFLTEILDFFKVEEYIHKYIVNLLLLRKHSNALFIYCIISRTAKYLKDLKRALEPIQELQHCRRKGTKFMFREQGEKKRTGCKMV